MTPLREALCLLGWCALAFLLGWWYRHQAADDAYIFHRYAANLLHGHGWVYNIGESVQGSTSPLNTLALAAAGLFFDDLALRHVVVFALAIGLACRCMQSALSRVDDRWTGVAGGIAILASPMLITTIGMESPLLVCGLAAAISALVHQRPVAAAAATAAATLVRPEAALLGLVLLGAVWRDRSVQPLAGLPWLRMLLVAATPLLLWAGFSTWAFGSPVPSTLDAKLAQTASGWWGDGWIYAKGLRRSFSVWSARDLLPDDKTAYKIALGASIAMLLGLLWRPHRILILIAYAALHTIAYSAINVPYYHWYGTAVHLCVGLGLAVWLGRMRRTLIAKTGRSVGETLTTAAAATVLFLTGAKPGPQELYYDSYRDAGAYLDRHMAEDASLGTVEIGVLGMAVWPRQIVDACGLVAPRGAAALRRRDFGWWIEQELPDWVVAHTPLWGSFERQPLERAVAAGLYRRVDAPEAPGVQLFRRIAPRQ